MIFVLILILIKTHINKNKRKLFYYIGECISSCGGAIDKLVTYSARTFAFVDTYQEKI